MHVQERSLAELAAECPPAICSYCREAIVHDGEMWRHVRTGLSAATRTRDCHPLCRDCDREGLIAVGADRFDGSGIRFQVEYFLCPQHAKQGPFIERT